MVADCIKDTNSDEELSEGDDDPVLLKELQGLAGDEAEVEELEELKITEEKQDEQNNTESAETIEGNSSISELIKLLQERLTIYEMAEQKAKDEKEPGRARRYNRGVRTLKEMIASVKSGGNVSEDEIPPLLPPSATTTESTVKNIGKNYIQSRKTILTHYLNYCFSF